MRATCFLIQTSRSALNVPNDELSRSRRRQRSDEVAGQQTSTGRGKRKARRLSAQVKCYTRILSASNSPRNILSIMRSASWSETVSHIRDCCTVFGMRPRNFLLVGK